MRVGRGQRNVQHIQQQILDIQAMTCLRNAQNIAYHQDHLDLSHHVTQINAMIMQRDHEAQQVTGRVSTMMRTDDLRATGQGAESVAKMGTTIFIAPDKVVQDALEINTETETMATALLVSVVALRTAIVSPRCVPITITVREITEAAVRPQLEDLTDARRVLEPDKNRLSASKDTVSAVVDFRFPLVVYSSKVPHLVPTTNSHSVLTPPNRVSGVSNQDLERGIVHK